MGAGMQHMSRRLVLGLPLALATCGKGDEDRLQGNWRVAEAERSSQPAPDLVGNELNFRREKFRISRDGRHLAGGSFALQTMPQPAWIDLRNIEGGNLRSVWLGIYRFTPGGGLEIADNEAELTRPRPRDFAGGPGYVVMRLVRV